MRRRSLAVAALLACVVLSALVARAQGPDRPSGNEGPGGPGGRPMQRWQPYATDSFAAERDSLVKLTMERIQGRENVVAESVYKNIQIMKGIPAERVLRSMNSIGGALGVPCSHCHVENHWADEDKKTKAKARSMMRMTSALNDSVIRHLEWPDDDPPHVGCYTCHQGHARPPRPPSRPGPRGPGGPGGPGGMGRPEGDRH